MLVEFLLGMFSWSLSEFFQVILRVFIQNNCKMDFQSFLTIKFIYEEASLPFFFFFLLFTD